MKMSARSLTPEFSEPIPRVNSKYSSCIVRSHEYEQQDWLLHLEEVDWEHPTIGVCKHCKDLLQSKYHNYYSSNDEQSDGLGAIPGIECSAEVDGHEQRYEEAYLENGT